MEGNRVVSAIKNDPAGTAAVREVNLALECAVLIEDAVRADGSDLFLYSYLKQKIESVKVSWFNRCPAYQGRAARAEHLKVARYTRVGENKLKQGEYVRILKPEDLIDNNGIPDIVPQEWGLKPCRFLCKEPSGKQYYPVLVKKADLAGTPLRGRLKLNGGHPGLNGLSKEQQRGIVVYDGGARTENARRLLRVNDEFELSAPQS